MEMCNWAKLLRASDHKRNAKRKNEGHLPSPFSEKISKAFTRFML